MLTLDLIRDLLNNTSDAVLSLYLHVDSSYQANQNEQAAWRIYTKNALRDDIPSKAIQKHVATFLDSYTPNSKSLVMFVNESAMLKHLDLSIAIENQHSFGAVDVVPLIWALDEYEPYLVVLVDQEQARFLSARLGRATTNGEMNLDFDDYDFGNKQFIHANKGSNSKSHQSSGADNFDTMKSEHIRRFHSDVAEHIRNVMKEIQAKRIIIGGSEHAAHQVERLLHPTIQNQLVDILSIPMTANDAEVAKQIQSTALNYERNYELKLVNEIIDLAKAGGRAAIGATKTLNALKRQHVEVLVLPYPMDDSEMATNLTLMALNSSADIELVHGKAALRLKEEGDAIARLYYRITEAEKLS